MSSVMGFELNDAIWILAEQGFRVEAMEVRSKKGQEGNEKRVVRQAEHDGVVCLTYAVFRTVMDDN